MERIEFKKDFRDHLIWVRDMINLALEKETLGKLSETPYNLFPSLSQLYRFMWCKSSKDFFKKVKS